MFDGLRKAWGDANAQTLELRAAAAINSLSKMPVELQAHAHKMFHDRLNSILYKIGTFDNISMDGLKSIAADTYSDANKIYNLDMAGSHGLMLLHVYLKAPTINHPLAIHLLAQIQQYLSPFEDNSQIEVIIDPEVLSPPSKSISPPPEVINLPTRPRNSIGKKNNRTKPKKTSSAAPIELPPEPPYEGEMLLPRNATSGLTATDFSEYCLEILKHFETENDTEKFKFGLIAGAAEVFINGSHADFTSLLIDAGITEDVAKQILDLRNRARRTGDNITSSSIAKGRGVMKRLIMQRKSTPAEPT